MAILTTVRCFRRLREEIEDKRRGVWLMTSNNRGVFFHGDREEAQVPRFTLEELETMSKEHDAFGADEIPPEGALKELEDWPEARDEAMRIFRRHPKHGAGE